MKRSLLSLRPALIIVVVALLRSCGSTAQQIPPSASAQPTAQAPSVQPS